MAVMTSTRTLRVAPFGDSTGNDAPAGAKVDVIQNNNNGWFEVRVPGAPGAPQGWVNGLAVDETRDTLGPIDKLVFATNCAWDSLIVETSAHYMLAVAELRTDIVDGPSTDDAHDVGPFALSADEWNAFSKKPELEIAFPLESRMDWLAQCMVFAVMANVMQKKMAAKLSDQPTVLELYLAQIVGSSAAHAILSSPTDTVANLLGAVPAAELAAEGISPARPRDQKYLGQPTGTALLAALTTDLQKALDDTRQYAAQASAQILASNNARLTPDGLPSLAINFDSPAIPTGRKANAMLIAARFNDAGYGSLQQIAAIANAIGESNLNEQAHGDNNHSHGLFQLNQAGGVGAGHTTTELIKPERNIAIMLDHIATVEKTADAAFRASTSILDAVSIFVRNFERPADKSAAIATRVGIAKKLVV